MADDKFDPYREALVMEQVTLWPAPAETPEVGTLDAAARSRIEAQLHAAPSEAAQLEYVRMHTGFRRQITVTAADLARLGALR
jgi:hypothetical protein